MKVITLEKTKELLGITGTDSDADITAKIPYIDSLVKQIANNRYNKMVVGDVTLDSAYVPLSSVYTTANDNFVNLNQSNRANVSGINNPYIIDDLEEYLEVGQLLSGTGIPAETYIEEVFYNGDVSVDGETFCVPTIKMSATATESNGGVRIYLGIPIAYQPVIAKGIQYLINQTSTKLPCKYRTRVGTVAYSDADSKIDGRYGMPSWFVKSMPIYQGGH